MSAVLVLDRGNRMRGRDVVPGSVDQLPGVELKPHPQLTGIGSQAGPAAHRTDFPREVTTAQSARAVRGPGK